MTSNITLYRPVGASELELIIDSGMKRFPPRLFWQPIFYPVLNCQYAVEIAARWNMGDVESDGAGFVTAFEIPEECSGSGLLKCIFILRKAMKTVQLRKNIYLIDNFWSPERCEDFIRKTETIGYEPATIETENGPRLVDFIRNNNRVIYKDFPLAQDLWLELKPYAPLEIGDSIAIGLNELFRFYKYQPGQQFKKHRDQSYIRNNEEASYFTFMIYLNDDFKGGATTFDDLVIVPKKGSALIFYHSLEHEGSEVLEGTKYVLRTDIMFRLK